MMTTSPLPSILNWNVADIWIPVIPQGFAEANLKNWNFELLALLWRLGLGNDIILWSLLPKLMTKELQSTLEWNVDFKISLIGDDLEELKLSAACFIIRILGLECYTWTFSPNLMTEEIPSARVEVFKVSLIGYV